MAFVSGEGRLRQRKVEGVDDLDDEVLWVDLREPTDRERQWVASAYGRELPAPEEMDEIEESARFFEDDRGLHINSLFLHSSEAGPHNITVSFTISQGRLFTQRAEDLAAFRVFRLRARHQAGIAMEAMAIMLELLDTKGDVAGKYRINGVPATYFIDKDGLIRDVRVGAFLNMAQIEGYLDKITP